MKPSRHGSALLSPPPLIGRERLEKRCPSDGGPRVRISLPPGESPLRTWPSRSRERSRMRWATETAEMIAANSPSAVQAVKRQVSATIADHALTREALEQQLGDEVRASPHFAEGIAAFRQKRRPRYE